jgi:DNA polymerase I-like protein with 3'-5' exonuclease and polymerase domains
METAIPLRVPMIMDTEIGPNWGQLTKIKLEK